MSVLLILISGAISAQEDTITYREELKENSDFNYRRSYQYLDIKMKNEKLLFKIAPFFYISNLTNGISCDFAFERKIAKAFSLQVFNISGMGFYNFENVFGGNLSLELRYYPGMKSRINKGLSGNNLSGLYISSGLSDIVQYSFSNSVFFESHPSLNGTLGYQSRLSNWAYLDVFAILSYDRYNLYFIEDDDKFYSTLGFRLGFAWGKNK